MLKSELTTLTKDAMDATAANRWSAAIIANGLDHVWTREWKGILDTNRYYRFRKVTVNAQTDGSILLTDLDTGSAATTRTHYKVLALSQADQEYDERQFGEFPLALELDAAAEARLWYLAGDRIQLLPATASASTKIWVNDIPAKPSLVPDATAITFPDSYELVLAYQCGAFLLGKGGAEEAGSRYLDSMAQRVRDDMLQSIARPGVKPNAVSAADRPGDWGG